MLSLPAEIILEIGHVLLTQPHYIYEGRGPWKWHKHQQVLAALVQTSKMLHEVFTPLLYEFPITQHLPRLASTLIQRPALAALVKQVTVRLVEKLPPVRGDGDAKKWYITPKDAEVLNAGADDAFPGCHLVRFEKISIGVNRGYSDDEGVLSKGAAQLLRAVLLAQCRNLEACAFEVEKGDPFTFSPAFMNNIVPQLHEMAFHWPALHSALGPFDTQLTQGWSNLVQSATNLKKLSLSHLEANAIAESMPSHSVVELAVTGSIATKPVWEAMLTRFPALTTFTYSFDLSETWSDWGMMNDALLLTEVVEMLEKHQPNLRNLTLEWDHNADGLSWTEEYAEMLEIPYLLSLRGLAKLEQIRLYSDGHILAPLVSEDEWVSFFPPRVHTIELMEGPHSNVDVFLLARAAPRFPSLKTFKYNSDISKKKSILLQKEFEANGVKIVYGEDCLLEDSEPESESEPARTSSQVDG